MSKAMEPYPFRYASMAFTQSGIGVVGINFTRDGQQFTALLPVADAKRLLDDLPEQVRIAEWKPDRNSN